MKIGRKVNGPFDFIVPEQYIKVGREHAEIVYNNGVLILHDLDSKNGTFVNGRRVATREIKYSDSVCLGDNKGSQAYNLDLDKVNSDFEKVIFQNKIDYFIEFKNLKTVYESYNNEILQLKRKFQVKSQLPKIAISVFIGLVILIASFLDWIPSKMQKFQYPVILIVMAGAGILSFTGKKTDVSDKLADIEVRYQKKYVCPKCKKKFNLNTHWKKIESDKTCPFKCGAIFSE